MKWQIGSLTIYGYGAAVACAAALALALSSVTMKNVKDGTRSTVAVLAIPLGVIGARALYALCSWTQLTMTGLTTVFRLTSGGYMLYGATLGVLAAVCLAARLTSQPAGQLLDGLAAPAALMIALCRLAEGLAGQGFGWYVADWFMPETHMSLFHTENYGWALHFPFAVQDMYKEWSWAVFVLEALVALVILTVLLKIKPRRPGWRALLLLMLYATSQIACEAMREDAVVRWGFVRANQVFSLIGVAAAVVICSTRLPRGEGRTLARAWLGLVLGAGLVVAMEFAVEQKIPFLRWMTTDLCFAAVCAGCLVMLLGLLPLWRSSGVWDEGGK